VIQVLPFDLGGVLVEFSGVRDVVPFMRVPGSEYDTGQRWRACELTDAFGLGRIGPEEFGDRFVRDWGLSISPAQFLQEFRSWSRRVLPGAVELLDSLRPQYRLAALSNSNVLHWERNTNDLGVTGLLNWRSRLTSAA
jgi:putative hydrolase of the HAD superfamily